MRDFNFFEHHLKKTKRKEKRHYMIFGTTVLLIIVIVAFPITNFVLSQGLKKDIAHMKSVIEAPENQEKIKRVDEKKILVEEFNKQLPLLENSHVAIQQTKYIDDYLIQDINDAIPRNMSFQSLTINAGSINVMGQAKDRSAVAEFEYNLRALDKFDDLFVPSITLREDGNVDFSMGFKVKDVIIQ